MILSIHLADVGLGSTLRSLARTPKPHEVPGLRYAATALTAPLGGGLRAPDLRRVGLIAAWDGDEALDDFLRAHPLAHRLRSGWHVRLEPLHAFGSWSALPELDDCDAEAADDEPVAVLTLGHLRKSQAVRFLRASRGAEKLAVADPAVLAATGLARPPGLFATFSLWRTVAAMRDYAQGRSGDGHLAASRAHKAKPFHSESVFARFRPYRSEGTWGGGDPLADVARHTPAGPLPAGI
jgi:hypothetical protein